MKPPAGFEARRARGAEWWLRPGDASWMDDLLRSLAAPGGAEGVALAGGRGGTRLISLGADRVVIRPYRRGGVPGRVVRDLYAGWRPRPFRELLETEALRGRGAPVVEVRGAVVRWVVPGLYRGWLVTRYVDGARTLWQWMSAQPAAVDRAALCTAAGRAVRRLHDCGGRHPDLNLNNLLVSVGAGGCHVHLIDFDRPLRLACPWCGDRNAELARLRRSARKLDPAGSVVTAEDLARIDAAYRAAGS